MRENKFRQLLNNNKTTNSTRLWSAWPFFTEVVGSTHNFDYIEFVAEYSPFTQYDLENIARAAELHNMSSMIKVDFQNRGYIAQKAISAGFQSINFADHHTADEVRQTLNMVRADCKGGGRFGYPNRRYIGTNVYPSQMEHVERINDIVCCFMIEKTTSIDQIEEICSIPGVDMLQFGPSDYSMSAGKNKADFLEECKEAEFKMIKTAQAHGVHARCEIQTVEEAQYYIDLGVKHFSLGDQFKILNDFWEASGKKMRETLEQI